MFRFVALGGVAAAVLSSGCCWRPFCGSGPALFNPPAAPLFPRLHPSYWGHPAPVPAGGPIGGPVGLPVGGSVGGPIGGGPDCPGCAGGGVPLAAGPISSGPGGGYPIGGHPGGGYPLAGSVGGHPGGYPIAGPTTVSPPPGLLAGGPQFSPMYFGQPAGVAPPVGSIPLPAPRAGDPPSAMPMSK